MKCACGRRAVIIRYHNKTPLCRFHFYRQLERTFKNTIRQNQLVENNDVIAVGLSGGKDSSLLLYLLHKVFSERSDISLKALFINEGIKGYRDKCMKYAKELCSSLDIDLKVMSFKHHFNTTIDEIVRKNTGISSCTFCGVLRRDLLNKGARALKATKLAIAHNLDDEVQSILMNYLHGDLQRFARLGPKTYVVPSEKFVPRIKPFREIPEKETALYTLLKNILYYESNCPYHEQSLRNDIRAFINSYSLKRPTVKFSILNTCDRLLPSVRQALPPRKLKSCEKCSEPSSRSICRKCELLSRLEE